jgi:hypothetical protein
MRNPTRKRRLPRPPPFAIPIPTITSDPYREEPTPDEVISGEEIPAEELPAEELPAEELPTEEIPTEEIPAEELPTEEIPVEEIPTEESTPTEEIPAEEPSTEEPIPVEEPTPHKETPAAPRSHSSGRLPPARFVKRASADKRTRASDGTHTLQTRPLRFGYKTLPKEENLQGPDRKHGHRQLPTDTGPKTKNERARARIAKVMSRLYDDD